MKNGLVFFVIRLTFVCLPFLGRAQDPQLSQFYAAPLLISPAFAGINNVSKVNFNYRNQWPNLSASYQFTSFTADINIESIHSGLGIIASTDKQFSNLQTTNFALQYAYHIDISSEHSLSLGMQGGFSSRGVDVNSLVTGDQISSFLSTGSLGSNMSDPLLSQLRPNVHYADFSTGALFNTKNYWIGASVHHLNAPNKTLINNTEDIIPPKYSLQMGMKIMLENSFYNADQDNPNNERSISPVLQYKQQGIFKQVDLGAYLTLSPLVIGAWYRGIPMEKMELSRESMVGLIGYKQDNFSIGYSYDLTVSKLGVNAGGAHEISLAYVFDFGFSMKKNPRIGKRTLSCPKF